MDKRKILIQLDPDAQPSVFDSVVATDAGVEMLFRHAAVTPQQVRDLVHGAIFTRGPQDLKSTAIFIGGSNVSAGETLLAEVQSVFFGPMRVSVMLDANGANTTAAAAVLACARHVLLADTRALVLGGTGPVGQRVARLLAGQGAKVTLVSRRIDRAEAAAAQILEGLPDAQLQPAEMQSDEALPELAGDCNVLVAAGAAGVQLVPQTFWVSHQSLQVVVDLNAVPPLGVEGVEVMDRAVVRDNVTTYGAIGVGATKMKIHKAALRRLFDDNVAVLDAEEIFALGLQLEETSG